MRGAEYFRRPEAAIERVCQDLANLGIYPEAKAPVEANDLLARVRENVNRLEKGLPLLAPTEPLPVLGDEPSDSQTDMTTETTPIDGTHFTLVDDHALINDDMAATEHQATHESEANTVHPEAAIVPLEVKHSDITLTPEFRDPVKVSLPTLTDVFDDETAPEPESTIDDCVVEMPDDGADLMPPSLRIETIPTEDDETVVDTSRTIDFLLEAISEACLTRGMTPNVARNDKRITIELDEGLLLEALSDSTGWRIEMPSVDGVRARGVANYSLVRAGTWKAWDLTDTDFANDKFVKDFASFAGRTAEGLNS